MIFFVLSESLLALNQLFKEMSSVFIRATRVFKFLPLNSTHVSSANRILKSNGETLHISLTDKIKKWTENGSLVYTTFNTIGVRFFTIKYHILCSVR